MIARRLTMRAALERATPAATDSWGHPVPGAFVPVATIACFAWSKSSREIADGKKSALVEDLRMMIALRADVRADDEIAGITDARGTVLIAGRLKVDGPVQHKHTHQEAALLRIGG